MKVALICYWGAAATELAYSSMGDAQWLPKVQRQRFIHNNSQLSEIEKKKNHKLILNFLFSDITLNLRNY